jgi:hypothetical protein
VKEKVQRFLRDGGDMRELALELHAWQVERVPHYARFCADARPQTLSEIPAVPVALFRDLYLCTSQQPTAVFRTSGTTTGTRGVHRMPDTDVYDLAARTWFETCVPIAPDTQWISLVPNPASTPDSSLGHMVAMLSPRACWVLQAQGELQAEQAISVIQQASTPVFIAATALALADLLQGGPTSPLPPNSTVMITGGFKGVVRTVSESELVAMTREHLGEDVHIIREYGMTELSSQLWDTGCGYQPPPWLHVYTIDPTTGEPCDGEGLLCFVDLANWGSCLAIETQDLGRVEEHRVVFEGRLPGAAIRGCSLTAEPS